MKVKAKREESDRKISFGWIGVPGVYLLMFLLVFSPRVFSDSMKPPEFSVKNLNFLEQTTQVIDPDSGAVLYIKQNQRIGAWTLMAVIQSEESPAAVFENLEDRTGGIVYMTETGIILNLDKSLEPTSAAEDTLYRGRTLEETANRKQDYLAKEILEGKGDPDYREVAACLPPLRAPTFVGTKHSIDKPTYDYGGFSDEIYVDAGKVETEIQSARDRGDVWEGLIGGWLPAVRFLFPTGENRYWEEVIFAEDNPSQFWTQPVWYRVLLVENGQLKKHHYFYHHLPFPPRTEPEARGFFQDLYQLNTVWKENLNPQMTIEVPDETLENFCRHAFAREIITRVGDHPKYGYPPLGGIDVFGGYGYSNVDTFQDVFNSSVMTFLDWGMPDIAGRYIDDYFIHSVREDGSIDTRGPEIGQYGRMLTALAMYYRYTKDDKLIFKHLGKIEAITRLFFDLRKESKQVPREDESYGIIQGWSEHDSALKVHPFKLMLPHFSNNAEAARGFKDLGFAWIELGKNHRDSAMEKRGELLIQESEEMKIDLYKALEKAIDYNQNPPYMPAVAHDTPTWGKGRVYTELMHSGILTKEHIDIIKNYHSENGHQILGLSGSGMSISGFRAFGPAYALIQFDWIREFLLLFYAQRAHLYTRGTWTAVEGANIDGTQRGPYCTPTQLTIPAFTKWMLVFEDPDDDEVWLAKSTPRNWLADGECIKVDGAPTRFGRIAYEIKSELNQNKISGIVKVPDGRLDAAVYLRLRVPGQRPIKDVLVNQKKWNNYDPEKELIIIPKGLEGSFEFSVRY